MSRRMGITLLPGGESGCTMIHGGRTQIKCRRAKISCQACLESKGLLINDGKPPTKKKSNSPNKRKSNAMGEYKYGLWIHDLFKSKKKIVLPSLVSQVAKDDAVMKDNEVISEQQQYIYCASKPKDEFDNSEFQSSTVAVPTIIQT